MKRHVILAIALTVCFSAFSQKTHRVMGWKITKDIPRNELKLNLGTTILVKYPEISYERLISEDFSVGASLGFSLDKEEYPFNFAFMPYARWFFGGNSSNLQKYGAGFFIEANTALLSYEAYNYDGYSENDLSLGAGLAVGWKYVSRNNWVGEINLGAGRNFDNSNEIVYSRLGITIGKRF